MSDTVPSMERVSELIAKHQRRGVPLPESGQLFFTKTVDADTLLALTHYAALRATLDVAKDALEHASKYLEFKGDRFREGTKPALLHLGHAATLRHLIQIQEGA